MGQNIEQRVQRAHAENAPLLNAARFTFSPFLYIKPSDFSEYSSCRPISPYLSYFHQLPRSSTSPLFLELVSTNTASILPHMSTTMSNVWTCCQCGGVNLVDTSPACPLCGHIPCGYCVVTAFEYPETSNNSEAERLTSSNSSKRLDLSGSIDPDGCSALSAPAPDLFYSPMPSCRSKKRGSKGVVPLNSLPYDGVWVCCQCGSANLWANCVRCPICAHDPCGQCS